MSTQYTVFRCFFHALCMYCARRGAFKSIVSRPLWFLSISISLACWVGVNIDWHLPSHKRYGSSKETCHMGNCIEFEFLHNKTLDCRETGVNTYNHLKTTTKESRREKGLDPPGGGKARRWRCGHHTLTAGFWAGALDPFAPLTRPELLPNCQWLVSSSRLSYSPERFWSLRTPTEHLSHGDATVNAVFQSSSPLATKNEQSNKLL